MVNRSGLQLGGSPIKTAGPASSETHRRGRPKRNADDRSAVRRLGSSRLGGRDGAGHLRRIRYITQPAIAPALFAVACLVTIASLRAFDVIFALTQGGPLNSTNLLLLLSYQASFQDIQFSRGAAIGSFAPVIVSNVTLIYTRTLRTESSRRDPTSPHPAIGDRLVCAS
jgi:hypothetical protein